MTGSSAFTQAVEPPHQIIVAATVPIFAPLQEVDPEGRCNQELNSAYSVYTSRSAGSGIDTPTSLRHLVRKYGGSGVVDARLCIPAPCQDAAGVHGSREQRD